MSRDWEALALLFDQAGDNNDILLGEGVEQQDIDLSTEKEIFLKEFPRYKQELEAAIKKHRDLADDLDKAKENFTKASLLTNSVSVASGAMTLLGLALAPATAGGSLILSAAGQGLGTVAGATNLVTNIVEHVHNKKAQAKASSQESDQKIKDDIEKTKSYVLSAGKTALNCRRAVKDIKKNIDAFRIARAHPRLATAAKQLLTTGQVSARRSRQVQKAFGGTTLTMARDARLAGSVMSTLFLGMDLNNLRNDYKQLKEGIRSEGAEELRAKADQLERFLTKLTQLYTRLQQEKMFSASCSKKTLGDSASAGRGKAGPRNVLASQLSCMCFAFLVLVALLKVVNWY